MGKGFVNAGQLCLDDVLVSYNRKQLKIEDISFESSAEATAVYNINVKDFHTYYVGNTRIFVHNAECHISRSKYPETAKHIEDAINEGQPDELTIDRGGAKQNRAQSLKGYDKVPGKQLDEYPPAMFKEGGAGAHVRAISGSDNMGSGSSMGHQLRPYPDGTKVKFIIDN